MGAVCLLSPASAAGQEAGTSPWPQFQGGPGHAGFLEGGVPPPYRVRWELPAPEGRALSGAVILDETVMTVGDGAVYGIDIATGEIDWEVTRSGGPLSVPAVVAGGPGSPDLLLYLDGPPSGDDQGSDPEGSDLVAIDLADRSERWRTSLDAQARTGVTVAGGIAYVGDQAGTLYAVGADDGEARWTVELAAAEDGCAAFPGMRIDAPIAVADDVVLALGANADDRASVVTAHAAATGECLWRRSPEIATSAASTPVAGGGRVVVAYADRVVRSLDARDGEQQWGSLLLTLVLPPNATALAAGAVFVADLGGGLYRLDVELGARDWSHQLNEAVVRSSPVVSGETVLVGLNDGRLVAVDAGSGHLVWESRPAPGLLGAIAIAPDVLVAVRGGREAGLVAFEHDPDGRLLDVPPPTELEPGTTLARAGIAAVIVLAVVLVPGIWARRRVGSAFAEDADDDEEGA